MSFVIWYFRAVWIYITEGQHAQNRFLFGEREDKLKAKLSRTDLERIPLCDICAHTDVVPFSLCPVHAGRICIGCSTKWFHHNLTDRVHSKWPLRCPFDNQEIIDIKAIQALAEKIPAVVKLSQLIAETNCCKTDPDAPDIPAVEDLSSYMIYDDVIRRYELFCIEDAYLRMDPRPSIRRCPECFSIYELDGDDCCKMTEEGTEIRFKCPSSECKESFCLRCGESSELHEGHETCSKAIEAVGKGLDEPTAKLIVDTTIPCPYCKTPHTYYFNHGCHSIKCTGCGKNYCAGCRSIKCSCYGGGCQAGVCKCPPCPDCKPGRRCANCENDDGCPQCNPKYGKGDEEDDEDISLEEV